MEAAGKAVMELVSQLKEEGEYPQTPMPAKRCPVCGTPIEFIWIDKDFLIKVQGKEESFWLEMPCAACEQQRQLSKEREERQQRFNRLSGNAMMKRRFIHKSFDNYVLYGNSDKQKRVFDTCRDYTDNFEEYYKMGAWLLFAGKPGTGKGHLAAAIINEILKKDYTALYAKARGLFRRLKESWRHDSGERESQIIEQLCLIDLLVIDDIGVQFGSQTEQDFLYDILDGRYEDYRPVVCTTNLELKEFEKIAGKRNVDRFYDRESKSKILVFDWESYRRVDEKCISQMLEKNDRKKNKTNSRASE